MEEKYRNLNLIFDEYNGTTVCKMTYDGKEFFGHAVCAPEDMDMLSKKTGEEIALRRCSIAVLKYEKQKIKNELNGLKTLYYSINTSKRYNPKSYEAVMLNRQIKMRVEDIADLEQEIKETDEYIKNYIIQKDDFYKKIRKIREKYPEGKTN